MSGESNYWHRFLTRGVSRRRALQAAALGGAGLAAAAALSCGGDEEEGAGGPATATTSATGDLTPSPGGTYVGTMADLYNMDPHKPIAFLTHVFASWIYSRLMRYATTYGELPKERRYALVPT